MSRKSYPNGKEDEFRLMLTDIKDTHGTRYWNSVEHRIVKAADIGELLRNLGITDDESRTVLDPVYKKMRGLVERIDSIRDKEPKKADAAECAFKKALELQGFPNLYDMTRKKMRETDRI